MASILRVIVAAALAVAGSGTAAAEWQTREGTAALTGRSSVSASLDSSAPLTNMIGAPEPATLVIRCQEGTVSAYVAWPQVLSPDVGDQTMVFWRVDEAPIETSFWDRSTDGTAAGKFSTGGAIKILRKLQPAHKLVVRMTGDNTQDAVFDLSDVAAIIAKVEQACGVASK